MGAVSAWVYQSGRLWPAILAHASNNIFCDVGIIDQLVDALTFS